MMIPNSPTLQTSLLAVPDTSYKLPPAPCPTAVHALPSKWTFNPPYDGLAPQMSLLLLPQMPLTQEVAFANVDQRLPSKWKMDWLPSETHRSLGEVPQLPCESEPRAFDHEHDQ